MNLLTPASNFDYCRLPHAQVPISFTRRQPAPWISEILCLLGNVVWGNAQSTVELSEEGA